MALDPRAVVALQRRIGNRATRALLARRYVFDENGRPRWVDDVPVHRLRQGGEVVGLTQPLVTDWLQRAGIRLEGGPLASLWHYLHESEIHRTYGGDEQQRFMDDLLVFNAERDEREQERLLRAVNRMADWIEQHYPPDRFLYVCLGRSPAAIMAALRNRHPRTTRALPLSNFRPGIADPWSILHDALTEDAGLGVRRPAAPLTAQQQRMLDAHLSAFVPGVPGGRDVLLIDYVQGAQSLIAAQHFLQQSLAGRGLTARVFALAIHRASDAGRVAAITRLITDPRSAVWHPLDRYYNTAARREWGRRFAAHSLAEDDPLNRAFSGEWFDPFARHGSYRILEQAPATFEAQRPRPDAQPPAGYDAVRDELRKL